MNNWKTAYEQWRSYPELDPQLKQELEVLEDNPEELEDAFYKELTFGTGGMRGIMGPGRNRMNIYTIRRAVYGLGKYLLQKDGRVEKHSVVVAYDSRYRSRSFAVEAAKVLGTFGIKTYIFSSLRPTPHLSFAVRYLQTTSGIMITASHNPPAYNGLKVYNEDGGQMVPEEADHVIRAIRSSEDELSIPYLSQEEVENEGLLEWIDTEVDRAYLAELKRITNLPPEDQQQEKNMPIVFTPLHGTARNLVMNGLRQMNFTNVDVVAEQAVPDPEFSTVTSPNPEEHQAFQMAIAQGRTNDASILLGTDPDADRLGVAVRGNDGEYTVLSGNQLGALLLDYILRHRDADGNSEARMLKTIVTTELGQKIADAYNVKTIDVLTGFKYISEKIREYDATNETFVFGFEESYGYLCDSFTRDKDAVQTAIMAAEMAYFWQKKGMTLLDALAKLYQTYGYFAEDLSSMTLEGKAGVEQIQTMMDTFRNEPITEIAGLRVNYVEDYQTGERFNVARGGKETIHLPEENVLKFLLEENTWVCLRPSGTEPKIKCYYGVCTDGDEKSRERIKALQETMDEKMQQFARQS